MSAHIIQNMLCLIFKNCHQKLNTKLKNSHRRLMDNCENISTENISQVEKHNIKQFIRPRERNLVLIHLLLLKKVFSISLLMWCL